MTTALPMAEHFCTYFDHRYAPHGLAMWRSLKAHHPSAVLHVLCLTEPCRDLMAGLCLADVCLYRLADLERADPELSRARDSRTTIEYYFTLTPTALLHVFHLRPDVHRLTYVDADLYFMGDPRVVFDEVDPQSIGVVEHRFPESLRDLNEYGRFNVGWLTFRRDATTLQCLADWRLQCLDWCHDRVENGRYADQKYLDAWPDRYPGVRVIEHPGVNLAPWNLARWTMSVEHGALAVNGQSAIFFHAHGFRPASPARERFVNLDAYGCQETALLREWIFDPYEQALTRAAGELGVPFALALLAEPPRHLETRLESALATLDELRQDLSVSEADRAARLELILELQRKQQELDTARTTLQVQLDELILRQDAELQRRDAERAELQSAIDMLRARLATIEQSRMWRWTTPLRQLAARLQRAR